MVNTRGERLRAARTRKFKSAELAARALSVPKSTFGAHERAQSAGGRDFGPDEARRYGQLLGVSPEWLLTGRRHSSKDPQTILETAEQPSPKIPIVGYVGAGAETHYYAVAQGELDEVEPMRQLSG